MSLHGSIILNGPFLVIYGVGIWLGLMRLAMHPRKKLLLVIGCILGLLNRVGVGIFYPLVSSMMYTGRIDSDSYVQWISNWGTGATAIEGFSLVLIIAAALTNPRKPEE